MTTVRTVAAYEIVRAVYPRPITEADRIGIAVGRAIDGALAEMNLDLAHGRRPTATSVRRRAESILDDAILELQADVDPAGRPSLLAQIDGVVAAFRKSELAGLRRPKSRLVLIGTEAGFYAQPDYWNGRDRFYEMKSYAADPVPPDVTLQVELFQLAYPGFRAVLAGFDRFVAPVTASVRTMPELSPDRREERVALAYRTALAVGQEKVLEYLEGPTVRYPRPASAESDPRA